MRSAVVTVLVASCFLAPAARAAPADLKIFAADPAVSDVTIAPDGRNVAYIRTTSQGKTLALLPQGSGAPQTLGVGDHDVSALFWIDSDHLMISTRRVFEAPPIMPRQIITQGVIFNLKTRKFATALGGMTGVLPALTGGPMSVGKVDGRTYLFLRGLLAGPTFNLFRVDLETGRGSPMAQDSIDGSGWLVDAEGHIVAELVHQDGGRPDALRVRGRNGWRQVDLAGRSFSLVGLGRTAGTVLVNLEDGPHEVQSDGVVGPALQPAGAEVASLIRDRTTSRLQGLVLAGEPPTLLFYDPALEAAWARAARAFPGKLPKFMEQSADASQIVLVAGERGTVRNYFWTDLKAGRAEPIEERWPDLAKLGLSPMQEFEFKARDGLGLKARLYRPTTAGAGPLPVVVAPVLTDWTVEGYPLYEAIASRGYAVLEVAGRGDSGLGPGVEAAGAGEFARRRQTDFADGLAAAASRGFVDRTRACIFGDQSEGYAALAAVTVQHADFRCAITLAPLADLRRRVLDPDPLERSAKWRRTAWLRKALGADARDPGLSQVSPLLHAAEGSAPVLLVQEADDPPEQVQETERMRAALARANRPVEMLTLKAKTRSLNTPTGREAMYAAILAFLARHNPA